MNKHVAQFLIVPLTPLSPQTQSYLITETGPLLCNTSDIYALKYMCVCVYKKENSNLLPIFLIMYLKKKKQTYFHSNFAVWAFRILMGSRLPSRKIKDGWNMFENLSLLELISERRKVNIAIHPETVEEISPTTWVMMIKDLTVI